MKALVTGGAGFIGFALARKLVEEDYDVTIVDNLQRGKADATFGVLLERDNVRFVDGDLTERATFDSLETDYRQVYHLAAINGTRHFYQIPHLVLRVNVLATINLLDWFAGSDCKKVVFASSSESYAGTINRFGYTIPTPEDIPLCIDDVMNPRWTYGGSKLVGELFFINYARQYKFDMSIVRYHNIYGERMGYDHVIPEFCQRLIKGENPFRIMGGDQTRAFCFIEDAVRATQLVMESSHTAGEIIHIGNDRQEIAMIDLAKMLFDLIGHCPEIAIEPSPEGSVERRCPDIKKLQSLTGYEPRVRLEEGLLRVYEYCKNDLQA